MKSPTYKKKHGTLRKKSLETYSSVCLSNFSGHATLTTVFTLSLQDKKLQTSKHSHDNLKPEQSPNHSKEINLISVMEQGMLVVMIQYCYVHQYLEKQMTCPYSFNPVFPKCIFAPEQNTHTGVLNFKQTDHRHTSKLSDNYHARNRAIMSTDSRNLIAMSSRKKNTSCYKIQYPLAPKTYNHQLNLLLVTFENIQTIVGSQFIVNIPQHYQKVNCC